jgi:iron complex outermembrane receptor protein
MNKRRYLATTSVAAAITLVIAAPAMAQTAQPAAPEPEAQTETTLGGLVSTGSLLGRSMKTGALPVQVITSEDLERRGDPSPLEMIKTIPSVGATIGDSNRFNGQNAGGVSINLRNLGSPHTLVLFNGRRLPTMDLMERGGVDVAYVPEAAIGRVEVLLDGASTTYGSDAMAGVVNFITRKDLNGLVADANYTRIRGSDGDYKANLAFGRSGDWGNVLLTAGYYHRSELKSKTRDWTSRTFEQDPQNGWSSLNPGSYLISGTTMTAPAYNNRFVDPGCVPLGGILTTGSSALCRYHGVAFNNLEDDTNGYQLFGEVNTKLVGDHKFHVDAFYSIHEVPHDVQDASYQPSTRYPLGTAFGGNNPVAPAGTLDTTPGFFIPANNPGLQTLIALNPGFFTPAQVNNINANGLLTANGAWGPYGYGGNLLTDGPQRSSRKGQEWRISGSFSGPLPFGMDYDVAATYGQVIYDRDTMEFTTANLQWALRGLGGFGCTPGGSNAATSTPGVGPCLWFNPFSTGISSNVQTGVVNPQFSQAVALNPQAQNSLEVARFIQALPYAFRDENRTFALDSALRGSVPFKLWGDEKIGWALGAQYVWTQDVKDVPPATAYDSAPCATPGVTTCQNKTGPLTFFGPIPPYDATTSRYGIFSEVRLPFTTNLEATLAVRYENLGKQFGQTTDPKVNVRWQVNHWLALRASASTTFKAPYITRLVGGIASGYVAPQTGAFVTTLPIRNQPLSPEKADNYSAGAIFTAGGFSATVDYYSIKEQGIIETDSATNIFTAFFGAAGATSNAHCTSNTADPYYKLQQRFVFTGGTGDPATCATANVRGINIGSSNSQDYDIAGLDLVVDYRLPNVLGGDWRFGADYNYVFKYAGSGSSIEGIQTSTGQDYAGTLGSGGFNALPREKGNIFAEYSTGRHNIRTTLHYVAGMQDITASIFPPTATNLFGQHMEAWLPLDIAYRFKWTDKVTLSASMLNVFDRDPPLQRQALGYNTYTANPFGRMLRVGIKKTY